MDKHRKRNENAFYLNNELKHLCICICKTKTKIFEIPRREERKLPRIYFLFSTILEINKLNLIQEI